MERLTDPAPVGRQGLDQLDEDLLHHVVGFLVVEVQAPRPVEFWHETGSAVMGLDPSASVVDATGQVHGVDGLYVADASVLPSAGAVNTGLTIIALAMRTGDAILGRLDQREPQEASATV